MISPCLLVAGLLFAPSQAPSLLLGVPQERRFQEAFPHRYTVQVAAGEYARIIVLQQGADAEVAVTSPSGQEIAKVDNPGERNGPEVVSILGEAAGAYTLEIRPRTPVEAEIGGYRIEWEVLRQATAEDRIRAEAESLTTRASQLSLQGRPEDLAGALDGYRRALVLWQDLGAISELASTHYLIGMTLYLGKQSDRALLAFEKALELWRESGDLRGMAKSLNQIGRTCRFLGDSRRALGSFQESISFSRQAGDMDWEGAALHNLARLQESLGDLPAALASYESSLEVYRRRRDSSGEALILIGLAGVYDLQGRPAEALEHFELARELAARLKQLRLEGDALKGLGSLHRRLGQPHQALESLLPALDRYGQALYFAHQAVVLVDLGELLAGLGEAEPAEEMLQRALPLLRDPSEEARARIVLSQIAQSRGDAGRARQLAEQALALQRRMEHPAGEAAALQALGFLHLDRGAAQQGREALEQALQRFEQIDSVLGQAETRRGLGQAATALGDFAAADRFFGQALALARELGNTAEEARILAATARSQRARGDLAAARSSLETSLDRLESLRSAIAGEELRASHFAAQRQTYEEYVDLLLQLHRKDPSAGLEARAFEAAERARARGLLDFLGQAQVDLREGDPALLAEESRLRLEMNAKAALRAGRLRKPGKAAEVQALDQELSRLATQYQIVEARLQASSPRYAGLRQPEIDLAEIQSQVLDSETVLLEYFLAEPHSVLWLVTPDTIASFELPGRAEIETLARRAHEALGSHFPEGAAEERKDLAALSRMLLGPVRDRIADKRLAIAADGALWYIPFAALPVPGSAIPLIVEHEIVQVPSAAVLRELRRSRAGRPRPAGAVALLADPVFERTDDRLAQVPKPSAQPRAEATIAQVAPPPSRDVWSDVFGTLRQGADGEAFERLPWSRQEAEAIAREAAQRQVLLALDFRASRELATSADLSAYRVVHFATHGILDTQHPQLSGLVFSQVSEEGEPRDGFLRLHDIYQMRLSADLVVLSACETALGKNLRGEGIVGLTHGFFHAGATQVLASLWPARDRATAELMRRFYRGMFHDGLRPSAALRQAQIGMWRDRTWPGPYFWAAFVLQGDWLRE